MNNLHLQSAKSLDLDAICRPTEIDFQQNGMRGTELWSEFFGFLRRPLRGAGITGRKLDFELFFFL